MADAITPMMQQYQRLRGSVPADVLTAALYTRFRSRQEHTFAEKMLSAMRHQFGGHVERPTGG